MSKRFRVRLRTDRIVGPFSKEQVGELYLKGHIDGSEKFQVFPAGPWDVLEKHPEISNLITDIINKKITLENLEEKKHSATMVRINPLKKKIENKKELDEKLEENEEKDYQEVAINENDSIEIDYDALEKKYQEKEDSKDDLKQKESVVESTKIIARPNLKEGQKIEKTVVIKLNEEDLNDDNEAEESQQEEEKEEVNFDEGTEMISLSEIMPALKKEISTSEKEIEEKIEQENGIDEEDDESEEDDDVDDEEESTQSKKKIKPIVALAMLVLLWVILDGPDQTDREPVAINIRFPVVAEVMNEPLARDYYEQGRALYTKGDYISLVLASNKFNNSLTHKFQGNPSLGHLVLVYAELFPKAADRQTAAQNLYRLIKIGQSQVLTDANMAAGTAIFFMNNGRYQTAINTIENFIRVSGSSPRIFAVYVEALIRVGNLSRAREVVERLESMQNKPIFVYRALTEFHKVNQDYSKAKELLMEALDYDQTQVPLLIELAEIELRNSNFKRFASITDLIEALDADRSPVYFAKLLEFRGILQAYQGNNEAAARFFRLALDVHETDELRTKLANLSLGGERAVEALVLESRVIDLMKRAERSIERREWDEAFVFAIGANDLVPNHIGAAILLSRLQIERGYFERAINTMRNLYQEFPLNVNVNYYYIRALIEANKLQQANNQIGVVDPRLHSTAEFAELLARYYQKRGDVRLAVRWFNISLERNPLNDRNYFDLAMIYLRNRNYNEARKNLIEAITLNPDDVYYRSAYAEILYELDGVSTAIGYLNEALERNPDHPKLIGDIAIYYYRDGQIRAFERYEEKLSSLNSRDPSFYEFKIESARLNNRTEDVIKHALDLVRLNPGDIDTRMMLAEFLIQNGNLEDAEIVVEEVLDRLASYPRANYLLAKIYLEYEEYEKAMQFAEREIQNNPGLEHGHFIKGRIFERQGDFLDATISYEQAISINHNYVAALMGLAGIKHRQSYFAEARQLYERARRQEQNNPRIYRQLGFVYRASGNSALAVESFETYLRLDPGASDRDQINSIIQQLR